MDKIKIGLIGFGSWVRSVYLPALNYDGCVEITAVTASSNSTKQLARQILGRNTAVFASYDELMEKAKIDAMNRLLPISVNKFRLCPIKYLQQNKLPLHTLN